MSLFGVRARNSAAGYSVVDHRLVLHGDLDTDGTVRVDGRVEGVFHRVGALIVGTGGVVAGNVDARDVIVAGSIRGSVQARGRLEIEPGASVHGDVQAHAMLLREGGVVEGMVSIGARPPAASVTPPAGTRRLELAATPVASQGVR